MSFFSSKAPAPAPIAVVDDSAARAAAAKAKADADAKMKADLRERQLSQTRVAGKIIADEEQQATGLMSAKRRAASRTLLG